MSSRIFVGDLENIPEGFDACAIPLDGRISSSLQWNQAKELAQQAKEKGLSIFWDLELGLFQELMHPFLSESELRTLGLAIEHFADTLWPLFSEQTIGLCVYKGSLDFSASFPWSFELKESLKKWLLAHKREDSEASRMLFCRDVCVDYLHLLASYVPQSVTPFLLLDASSIFDPLLTAQLLDNDKYERFSRGIEGSVVSTRDFVWNETKSTPIDFSGFIGKKISSYREGGQAAVGVFLPHEPYDDKTLYPLREVFNFLNDRKIPYRLVSEEQLIADWDGLDDLIVVSETVTSRGLRKLYGFSAAGGRIVEIGENPLSVEGKITYIEWIKK